MKLEGIHHITAITGDGPRNVDFYARVLGLRLVKKTVNQDDPTAYHLFFADEEGSAGADLTFFEYPGARRGQAGPGMIHRIVYRVGSPESLEFWADRLGGEGVEVSRVDGGLRFADPEGLEYELRHVETGDAPLVARSREVPEEHALQGFHAVHARVANPEHSARLLTEGLGMTAMTATGPVAAAWPRGAEGFGDRGDHVYEARGERRGGAIVLEPGSGRSFGGAGTVHHIAWATTPEEHEAWRDRVLEAGARATPVIDRFYFKSVYFREPSGILYELATLGPGFTTDEPLEHLGERLSLPPAFEHLRDQVERSLTPLPDTRQWRPAPVSS